MSAFDLPWIMERLGYPERLIAGASAVVEEPRLEEVLSQSPIDLQRTGEVKEVWWWQIRGQEKNWQPPYSPYWEPPFILTFLTAGDAQAAYQKHGGVGASDLNRSAVPELLARCKFCLGLVVCDIDLSEIARFYVR